MAKTKRVYRFENVMGVGMYRHKPLSDSSKPLYESENLKSSFALASGQEPFCTDRWPSPYADIKFIEDTTKKRGLDELDNIRYSCHDKFGFSSVSQMKRWVYKKKWRKALSQFGMDLCVYEVPLEHVIIGTSQCTFDSRYAELVEVLDTAHYG